jgi:hypothetical protein
VLSKATELELGHGLLVRAVGTHGGQGSGVNVSSVRERRRDYSQEKRDSGAVRGT